MPIDNIEELSDKQIHYIRSSHAPINLAYGAVRSGKNFSEAARLAVYLKYQPYGHAKSDFIFAGASIKAIHRIVLKDLFELVGEDNYTYNRQDGSGSIYGRDFYSFGFCKANSHEAMRGMTAGGAMLTELTLCHEDFWDELNLRVSLAGGIIFADTNPGPPNHWVKKKILDNPELRKAADPALFPLAKAQLHDYHFLLDDNPFMAKDPGYTQRLLAMYPPGTLLHKRMILGLWAAAEGRIFDAFDEARHVVDQSLFPREYDNVFTSVDYGTQNTCVYYLVGLKNNRYHFIKEYAYSGREEGHQQVNSEYRDAFTAHHRGFDLDVTYVDPSAAAFKEELSRSGYNVEDAVNDVLPGIQCCNELLATDRVWISKQGCPRLPDKLQSYGWDLKAQAKGIERPLKVDDNECDAFRYALASAEEKLVTTDFWTEFMREELHAA